MIWFNEELTFKDQPDNTTVSLLGCWQEPQFSTHKMCILFLINDGEKINKSVIEVKDPTSLCHEEPTAEEVLAKYSVKMNKIKQSISPRDYKSFLIWVKSRSLFIRGRSSSY